MGLMNMKIIPLKRMPIIGRIELINQVSKNKGLPYKDNPFSANLQSCG